LHTLLFSTGFLQHLKRELNELVGSTVTARLEISRKNFAAFICRAFEQVMDAVIEDEKVRKFLEKV
jgi:hypothetical protein